MSIEVERNELDQKLEPKVTIGDTPSGTAPSIVAPLIVSIPIPAYIPEVPSPVAPAPAPQGVPSGGSGGNIAALQAAYEAWQKGHDINSPEVFEAAKLAVEAESEASDADAEAEAVQYETILKHEYYAAICNAVRGVEDLSLDEARKAAASLHIKTVSFDQWRARIGA